MYTSWFYQARDINSRTEATCIRAPPRNRREDKREWKGRGGVGAADAARE